MIYVGVNCWLSLISLFPPHILLSHCLALTCPHTHQLINKMISPLESTLSACMDKTGKCCKQFNRTQVESLFFFFKCFQCNCKQPSPSANLKLNITTISFQMWGIWSHIGWPKSIKPMYVPPLMSSMASLNFCMITLLHVLKKKKKKESTMLHHHASKVGQNRQKTQALERAFQVLKRGVQLVALRNHTAKCH